MKTKKKYNKKFIIFSLVGIFNTLFDIILYVVIFNVNHSILAANTIATSAALLVSYVLNSRLTFKSKHWTVKSLTLFVTVTVFGLWFLQTGIIYLISPPLQHISESIWRLNGPFEEIVKTVLPKLLATAVTFIWNYLWYSKVIFKGDATIEQTARLTA